MKPYGREKKITAKRMKDIHPHPKHKYVNWWEDGKMQSTITWHSVSEIPNEMRELLCEWEFMDATWHVIAFYHSYTNDFWNGSTKIEGVTKWIYIDELLEILGEQNTELTGEINYEKCKS